MLKAVYKLSKEQIADYKELFLLFDKDENGILSFAELCTAMRTLGQRLSGYKLQFQYLLYFIMVIIESDLLLMVKAVSEDKLNNTIEFNEFLKMMSKQNDEDISEDSLIEAFK